MGLQTYTDAAAERRALEYQSNIEETNAKMSETAAQDAAARGHESTQDNMMKISQERGKAKTSLAARGLSLDTGSALSILEDVDYVGDIENSRIKTNAGRETWGHRVEASNHKAQANLLKYQATSIKPGMRAATSMLQMGGSFVGK
jgi:hypothetical protein